MIESIRTRTGKLSVDTNQHGQIKFIATGELSAWWQQTHTLTVEQCNVLIHALARAIELDAKKVNEIDDETLDAIRLALQEAKKSLDYHCFYSTNQVDDAAYKAIDKAQQLLDGVVW